MRPWRKFDSEGLGLRPVHGVEHAGERSPHLDVRHLLCLLAECDIREVREKLAAQLFAELDHVHKVRP